MSSSEARKPRRAKVSLTSAVPGMQFALIDSRFQAVAKGTGALTTSVDPGIYRLVFRAGGEVSDELITLGPGERLERTGVTLPFPSAAPIQGTSTDRPAHRAAVNDLLSRPMTGVAGGSRFVVMVRNLDPADDRPVDHSRLMLTDNGGRRVAAWRSGWVKGDGFAAWSVDRRPGGHALRLEPPASDPTAGAIDQSVWLAPSWATLVFVPNETDGPEPSNASVHMAYPGAPWSVDDINVGLALELTLAGIRRGKSVVPDDLLALLLNTKFTNPMLGIVGAQALSIRWPAGAETLKTVVGNLRDLVPGHPDVEALRAFIGTQEMAGQETSSRAALGVEPVRWPPMMSDAYQSLIRADASYPGLIPSRSVAERAAAHLAVVGAWTAWTAFDRSRRTAEADAAPARPSRRASKARPPTGADLVEGRVSSYLSQVGEASGETDRGVVLESRSVQEIAAQTALPTAAVKRAIRAMRKS